MKYWAFLSYSHRDAKWGDWLHNALETYRVPRRLVGKESRDGTVPERVFPIFRDREELPVSADLGANITQALEESRYLIVICSPHSAQSRWVGEEIKSFKRLGREDRILALIVDGEPNASDGQAGVGAEQECFPEALRYRLSGTGEMTAERAEPIAADAREGKDGKGNAKLKLLAGLLGVNYDDLRQREQERRLRRARFIITAAVVLIGVFAALSVALFFKEREARSLQTQAEQARDEAGLQRVAAEQARDEARLRLSENYFERGLGLLENGDRRQGVANLIAALRADPNNTYAADRLLFELNYGDWLVASAYVPLPLELSSFNPSFEETPVLHARLLEDGKTLEATTFDYDGRPARVFQSDIAQPDWKLMADQRKPLESKASPATSTDAFRITDATEHFEVAPDQADALLNKLKELGSESDRGTTYFSEDQKWAAALSLEERPLAECTISLFDLSNGRRIVVRDLEGEEEVELTGLPVFDTAHGLAWLFRSNPAREAPSQLAGAAQPVLEAIDLAQAKSVLDGWFLPTRGIEALRPRVSRNGNWLTARYSVNNRAGETLNAFEVALKETPAAVKLIGQNVMLPGQLRQVTEDGKSFVAVLPAAVAIFQLLGQEALAGQAAKQPGEFEHAGDGSMKPIEAISSDGKLRAAGDAQGHFTVYEQPGGTSICSFESGYVGGEGGRVCVHAAFSPDSRFLLVWGYSTGGGIVDTEIYDPRRGRLLYPRFTGTSHGVNDRGLPGVRKVTSDNRGVELLNDQTVMLRFAGDPMPPKFAEFAEGLIGARIDAQNVYQVFGQSAAPPCVTAQGLKGLADELESGSDWTKFAKQRLSSIR